MTKLECQIGMMSPKLDRYGSIPNLTEFIQKHFEVASRGDVSLACTEPKMIRHPLSQDSSVTALELHNALAYLTGNPIEGPISRIGILLAESYEPFRPALGVMFDRGFATDDDLNSVDLFTKVPREGCAVFLGAISELRSDEESYAEEVLFTTVHELGHVFNLHHDEDSINFMARSQVEKPYGPAAFHFSEDQKDWLSQCSTNPNVRPGGSPFMDTGTYGNLNIPPYAAKSSMPFGLELNINCWPREFWKFEPIQLDIELRLIGGGKPSFDIPDELDPGYGRFRLMIEDSLRERHLYRSPQHYCGVNKMRKITQIEPYRRDIPVFGQSGGYTFRRAGLHTLWIEFDTGHGVLRSNKLDVFIKPENSVDVSRENLRNYLSKPNAARTLFFREDLPDHRGIKTLADCINAVPDTSTAAEIHYTIGRTSLALSARNTAGRKKHNQKALHHLRIALDYEHLGTHRKNKAQAIIDKLSRTS